MTTGRIILPTEADPEAPITAWQRAALTDVGAARGLTLDALAALGAERLGLPRDWSALTVAQARRLMALAQSV